MSYSVGTGRHPWWVSTSPTRALRRCVPLHTALLLGRGRIGPDLFVGSGTLNLKRPTGSVTEINASTGALVRRLSGVRYQFWDVGGMAVSGDHVFLLNVFGRSLTEFRASTGNLVRVIAGASYGFSAMDAIAVSGPRLFVANFTAGITVIDASTGAPLEVDSAPQFGFDAPDAIAVGGHEVFVANSNGNSVTELPG